ncbi:DegT/DnrJ/EryC1/StrS family aminotransferase [Pseudomonas asplenii]|uniref:DegT/DnrJ/EryC1/StrS family aminotransferase n=1 Tax=Pseudomonas asplenii TaxID=53407 RepID=UPI0009B77F41|nr:DegT/DnrJ/EryC1/StrS family aminotransferase [Pseudomonas fuscovaginae]
MYGGSGKTKKSHFMFLGTRSSGIDFHGGQRGHHGALGLLDNNQQKNGQLLLKKTMNHSKTRGLPPIHLYGQLAPMPERMPLAEPYPNRIDHTLTRLPKGTARAAHGWHLFVIERPGRDALKKRLTHHGVQTDIHYPLPIPRHRPYADLALSSAMIAAGLCERTLSRPIYPTLGEAQQDYVIDALNQFSARQETIHEK